MEMIQSNELRMGNLLEWNKTEFKVCSIFEDSVENEQWNKQLYELHPITLTEKWLLKAGFCKMDDSWYTHENYNLECDERGFWLSFQTLQVSEIFNFVHQIQNLNYALTGQELEFSE